MVARSLGLWNWLSAQVIDTPPVKGKGHVNPSGLPGYQTFDTQQRIYIMILFSGIAIYELR